MGKKSNRRWRGTFKSALSPQEQSFGANTMQCRAYSNLYYRCLQDSRWICVLESCKWRFSKEYYNNFHPTAAYRKTKVSSWQAVIVRLQENWEEITCTELKKNTQLTGNFATACSFYTTFAGRKHKLSCQKCKFWSTRSPHSPKPSFRYGQTTDTRTLVILVAFQIFSQNPILILTAISTKTCTSLLKK